MSYVTPSTAAARETAVTQTEPRPDPDADPLAAPFTPGMSGNDPALAELPEDIAGPVDITLTDRRTKEFVETWRNASYNCYSSGPQVLPRGLPGHAGHPERILDADCVPRQRRGDGAGRTRDRRRGSRLRQLHAMRRLRTALPEHACSPATSTSSGPEPSTWSRPCARSPSTAASTSSTGRPGMPRTNDATHEPVLGDTTDHPEPGPGLGGRPGHPDRRRDGAVRRLRGRLLPDQRAAGRRADPAVGRLRIRPDGRAVVLRRTGRRDGLRRPGQTVRRTQPGQLAVHRHHAGSWSSTRTTTSPSPRTTRSTSAPTSTSRSSWRSSFSPI